MPMLEYFKDCPEFPVDTQVSDIPIISLKALQENSEKESKNVFEASIEHGLFLLDLKGAETGENLLKNAEAMFEASEATFDLEDAVLLKHICHPPKDLRGYKPAGTLKTEGGKFDAIEVYTLNQDDILGNCDTPHANPEPLEAHAADMQSFFNHAHQILLVIFSQLEKYLGLAPGTLAALCPLDKPSATALRLLITHPGSNPEADIHRIAFAGHTDVGLITMLFNIVGGLQILPAGMENIPSNWLYIKPRPGCVICQMGDTIVQLTGGVLRSALHRVVTPPGKQGLLIRRSLAYLVRVEDNASMRRLKSDGSVIPELLEGEEDDTRTPAEWAEARIRLVMNGQLAPQTTGGRTKASIMSAA